MIFSYVDQLLLFYIVSFSFSFLDCCLVCPHAISLEVFFDFILPHGFRSVAIRVLSTDLGYNACPLPLCFQQSSADIYSSVVTTGSLSLSVMTTKILSMALCTTFSLCNVRRDDSLLQFLSSIFEIVPTSILFHVVCLPVACLIHSYSLLDHINFFFRYLVLFLHFLLN